MEVYCIDSHSAQFFGRRLPKVRHTLNHFYDRKLSSSHTHQKTWLTQLYCFSEINRAVLIYISPRANSQWFIPVHQHNVGTQQKQNKYSASVLQNWSTTTPVLKWKEATANTWLIPEISCLEWTHTRMNGTCDSRVTHIHTRLNHLPSTTAGKLDCIHTHLQREQYFCAK